MRAEFKAPFFTVAINAVNENTILLELIDPSSKLRASPSDLTASFISKLDNLFRTNYPTWILDIVPAYDSMLIYFDFLSVSSTQIIQTLSDITNIATTDENRLIDTGSHPTRIHRIPVDYSLKKGIDLERVASLNNTTIDQVIYLHGQRKYRVYAVGFMPNFAYLGFVPKKISTPRQAPRKNVPKGAVGIAENQTGIYPSDSPGGWNIIGQCTTSLPTFKVGDIVQFFAT